MPKLTMNQILPEKKCKKCGKKFIPAPQHIYKENSKYFCSWTCYLHRNDKEAVKRDQRATETIPKHKNRD